MQDVERLRGLCHLLRPDCHRKMMVGAPFLVLKQSEMREGFVTIHRVLKNYSQIVPAPLFNDVTRQSLSKDFSLDVTSSVPSSAQVDDGDPFLVLT